MIRTKLSFLFLIIFVVSVFSQERGKITGKVIDFENKPIAGVNIILVGSLSKTQTDRLGNYVLDHIYSGKYSLFAFKSGFFSILLDDIEVKAGTTVKINLKMKPDPEKQGAGAVTIKIVDERGRAVSNATATIAESVIPKSKKFLSMADFYSQSTKWEASSDNKGMIRFQKIPAGRYNAIVSHKGFSPHVHAAFLVLSEETTELKVNLHTLNSGDNRFAKLVGFVHSMNGEAIPGANIFIKGTVLGAASDAEGNFVIQNIPPGRYMLLAKMIGFKTFQKTIVLTEAESKKLDITLKVEKFSKSKPKTELEKLEARVYELRAIYFTMPTDKQKKQIKQQMREVLENIFSLKENKNDHEIEQLKRRIDMLEQWQRDRAKRKQEIIERRLKALLTIY